MCWWPCCGGWVTTRHYETNLQRWYRDHGNTVYAVAGRETKVLSGGGASIFATTHIMLFRAMGDPTSATFDIVWDEETIATGITLALTAAALAAILDTAEIAYVEVTGGPLDTEEILVRLPNSVKTQPVITIENASFTGGDDPYIEVLPKSYTARQYSESGSLEETFHNSVVEGMDAGVSGDKRIYLADGGVHVYSGNLETEIDRNNPWGGNDKKISVRDPESVGFTTSGKFGFGSKIQIFQSNGTMLPLFLSPPETSYTRQPFNTCFVPDDAVVIFWHEFIAPDNRWVLGVSKYSTATGEELWTHDSSSYRLREEYPRGWSDGDGYSYFQYSPTSSGGAKYFRLVKLDLDGEVIYDVEAPYQGRGQDAGLVHGADDDYALVCSWFMEDRYVEAAEGYLKCIDLSDGSEVAFPGSMNPNRFLDSRFLNIGGGNFLTRAEDGGSNTPATATENFYKGAFGNYQTFTNLSGTFAEQAYDSDVNVDRGSGGNWCWTSDSSGNIYDFRFFKPVPHPDTGDPTCLYLDSSLGVHYFTPDGEEILQTYAPTTVFIDGEGNVCSASSTLNVTEIVRRTPSGSFVDTRMYAGSSAVLGLWTGTGDAERFYKQQTNAVAADGRYSMQFSNSTEGGGAPKVSEFNDSGDLRFSHVIQGDPEQVEHDPDGNLYVVSDLSARLLFQWNLCSWESNGDDRWHAYHGAPLRACKAIGESLYVGGDLSLPIYIEFGSTRDAKITVTQAGENPSGTFNLNLYINRPDPTPDLNLLIEDLDTSISAVDLETEINDIMAANSQTNVVTVTGGPLSSGTGFELSWSSNGPPTLTIADHKLEPRYTIRRYDLDGTYFGGFGVVPVNSIDAINEELIIAAGERGISSLQIETIQEGDGSQNAIQRLRILDPMMGATFRLTKGESESARLTDAMTDSELQVELESMNSIGTGNVLVTGGPLASAPVEIEFVGDLANTSVELLQIVAPKDLGTTRRYTGAGVLEKVWDHGDDVHSVWVDRDDPEKFTTGGRRVGI